MTDKFKSSDSALATELELEWMAQDEIMDFTNWLVSRLTQTRADLAADLRDWNKLAEELGCEPTREAMSKTAKGLRSECKY